MSFRSPIYIDRNLKVFHFHIIQYKCLHLKKNLSLIHVSSIPSTHPHTYLHQAMNVHHILLLYCFSTNLYNYLLKFPSKYHIHLFNHISILHHIFHCFSMYTFLFHGLYHFHILLNIYYHLKKARILCHAFYQQTKILHRYDLNRIL